MRITSILRAGAGVHAGGPPRKPPPAFKLPAEAQVLLDAFADIHPNDSYAGVQRRMASALDQHLMPLNSRLLVSAEKDRSDEEKLGAHVAHFSRKAAVHIPAMLARQRPRRGPGDPVEYDDRSVQCFQHECAEAFCALDKIHPHLAAAYATVVDPTHRLLFGMRPGSMVKRFEAQLPGSSGGHLTFAEHIALREIAHPHTGAFNAHTAMHVLDQHLPNNPFRAFVAPILDLIPSALAKLREHPEFRFRGTLYRGEQLSTQLYREYMAAVAAGQAVYTVDRPLSSTSNPHASFAGRLGSNTPYEIELEFRAARGIVMTCFHPEETLHQQEVYLDGRGDAEDQVFKVIAQTEKGGDPAGMTPYYTSYVMEPL